MNIDKVLKVGREFWLVRDPITDKMTAYVVKPSWNSMKLGDERIHVVEKSALDAALAKIAKLEAALEILAVRAKRAEDRLRTTRGWAEVRDAVASREEVERVNKDLLLGIADEKAVKKLLEFK